MFECKICGEKMEYIMATFSAGSPKAAYWCQNDGSLVISSIDGAGDDRRYPSNQLKQRKVEVKR
jgi:hypothetical protein